MNENYYQFNFDDEITDDETISYYNAMSKNQLIDMLNLEFDNIGFDLKYYAKIIDFVLKGNDYNEHYYKFMCLAEELNNIKIILTVLKDKYHD